ncbi:hypothetical protein AB833_09870 [Chromatiales bacterium (ex Bugula neritina AB1)]|nr:hypothetical protein AB833_09870 [Chromatiales bacterium (ex Bugula neritina AB1)]
MAELGIAAALTIVVELAVINLVDGKTETDLIEASNQFQRDFLDHQPGFIRRELVRKTDSEYLDIIHWRSQDDVDAVMKTIHSSPAVQAYFSVMEFDSDNPDSGVELYSSITAYEILNSRK